MQITECDEAVSAWLEMKLLSSLRDTTVQAGNSNIMLAAKQPEGQIMGGLVARTSYGWLLIKILWVDRDCRRSGLGRSMMEHAESLALKCGCHGAWLDTSSPDAHQFYLSLGYESFGELHNLDDQIPPGHRRWFMKKSLGLQAWNNSD